MSIREKCFFILLCAMASVSWADPSPRFFPAGNEYVALPTIREKDGALEQVNVLHMGVNGLLAFSGGAKPFLTPRITVNEKEFPLEGRLTWDREADWLPRFRMKAGSFEMEGIYFAPPGERGFALSMKVKNISSSPLKCALNADLAWADLL